MAVLVPPKKNLSDLTAPFLARANLDAPLASEIIANTALGFSPAMLPGCDAWFCADQVDQGVYGYDLFARPNSASSLGVATSGQTWTSGFGTLGITSKHAYAPSGSSLSTITTGVADCVLEADVFVPSGGGSMTLVPRFSSTTNYIQMNANITGGSLQLAAVVAGVTTGFAFQGSLTFTLNGLNRIKITAKGAVYTVYLNGVLKLTGTDPNTLVPNATAQGFRLTNDGCQIYSFAVGGCPLVDGDSVAGWADLANVTLSAGVVQATVANRPTYKTTILNGHAVVRFDGTNGLLTSATLLAAQQPVTVVVVLTRTAGATVNAMVDSSGTAALEWRVNANGTLEALSRNTASIGLSADAITSGSASVLALTLDASGRFAHYINGRASQPAKNAITLSGTGKLALGGTAAGERFNGDIAEVVRFNRVLSGRELKSVTHSLAAKYGVTLQARLSRQSNVSRNRITWRNRIKGVNISPASADYTTGAGLSGGSGNPWYGMWQNWDWTYLSTCVDLAAGLGANAIRTFGDIEGIFLTLLSQSTFNTRLAQLADYINGKGMAFYFCLLDFRHSGNADVAAMTAYATSVGSVLATRNVMAIDLCNELGATTTTGWSTGQGWPETLAYKVWIPAIYSATRVALPTVPITVSEVGKTVAGTDPVAERLADYAHFALVDPYVDFHDAHNYDLTSPTSILNPYLQMSDKPILFGEFGADANTASSAERTAEITAVAAMVAAEPQLAGGFAWDIVSTRFGLFNTSYVEQTDRTTPFRTLPGGVV